MKPNIKLLICIIIGGFMSCNQENSKDFISNGIITGPDIRMCACCGGWYIQIDGIIYEFDSLPDNSSIDLQKETFPVFVKLDWKLSDKGACPSNRITIQRIIKE